MTNRPLLSETTLTLKTLCTSCGLTKTGPKRVLIQRLRHAARHFQPLPPEARILSIDLGLKNFAFSLLTPAAKPPKQKPPATHSPLTTPVHLHAWKRLDLTIPSSTPPSTPTKNPRGRGRKAAAVSESSPPQPQPPESAQPGGKPDPDPDPDPDPYSPSTMSQLTLNLVQSHLLPLRPTHVLIERQRFRTGGAAAIFEWTLRVNTLEAMLHAVFASLNGRTQGAGWEGKVESVLPRGVVGFMFHGDGADKADAAVEGGEEDGVEGVKGGRGGKKKSKAGKAYQMLKREKVDVLGKLLRDEGMVIPEEGQVGEMVRLFLGEWGKRGLKKRRTKKGEDVGDKTEDALTKMDDLSDAVLQGMAWMQWQRNLEALIKERPELLVDGDEE